MRRNRKQQGDLFDQLFAPLLEEEPFTAFGLTSSATREDVMSAYRQRVKDMADGKGGYTGDMDKLVEAKDKAIRRLNEE